ncbi:MAG: NAD-dependent epimerase/dehydratase family protein [Candidatus Riflebacteria bacterium]|nr:NAD-dependent epimerase/dehydratase family protein [Candidatus Riflebacteria bacterium]
MENNVIPLTEKDCAFVTGGGGFLGFAIVKALREKNVKVKSFSRNSYPQLEKIGVEHVKGELTNPEDLTRAMNGCNIVFHVAAKAGMSGAYEDYYNTNYLGTVNVIDACRSNGIKRLVYTSSPSVIFDGKDMEGVDESVPYPEHYEAHYPKTKAMAEKAVIAANASEFATVALRPHLIWGPGDNNLIPRILSRARAGRLRIIGENKNKVDTIYIDTAANAHILAAERLFPGSPVSGKKYFISQGDPRFLWDIVNAILVAAGEKPLSSSISAKKAYYIGYVLEMIWKIFCISGEPPMSRWVAQEMATAHWFNISAARKELNFNPEISIEEGMKRLAESFQIAAVQP